MKFLESIHGSNRLSPCVQHGQTQVTTNSHDFIQNIISSLMRLKSSILIPNMGEILQLFPRLVLIMCRSSGKGEVGRLPEGPRVEGSWYSMWQTPWHTRHLHFARCSLFRRCTPSPPPSPGAPARHLAWLLCARIISPRKGGDAGGPTPASPRLPHPPSSSSSSSPLLVLPRRPPSSSPSSLLGVAIQRDTSLAEINPY